MVPFKLSVYKLVKHFRQLGIHIFIGELAGADSLVSAAAVFEHKLAYVNIGGTVENGVTHSGAAALAALAVDNPCGNVLLGIEAVNQEAVARIDGVNASRSARNKRRFFP